MLSKETFVKVLKLIDEQEAIYFKLGETLEELLGGYYFVSYDNKYSEALSLILREIFNDTDNLIECWRGDIEDIYLARPEAKSWDLTTPESLYDCLIKDMNSKK